MQVISWVVVQPSQPMVLQTTDETAGPGEVLIKTAACGVCHTDLAPLTLGHEISGRVVAAVGAARVVRADVQPDDAAIWVDIDLDDERLQRMAAHGGARAR